MGIEPFDQWTTTKPFLGALPSWVGEDGALRIAAYQLYEEIYWGVPESFKVIQRGSDTKPIYIPSGKQIVETLHRYIANKLNVIADPNVGTESEQIASLVPLNALFRRERFYSLFSANKRYGLIRGDWCFQLYADPAKEAGSRISIYAVDPGSVFKVPHPENPDITIAIHIAEQVLGEDGKPYIYRGTYRKTTEAGGPSPITFEEAIYKVDEWGGPGMKDGAPQNVIRAPELLPDPILSIPIYHIPSGPADPNAEWGSSEMRGIERLMAGINQGISDEDLTLAMDGLGMYSTDAGSPIDDEGQPVPWNLGPAKVIEVPGGKKFERISGVTSVAPYQDHLKYLHDQLDASASIPGVAKGRVTVDVAESGIALQLELAPILAVGEERDLIITDVLTQMLFDLKWWFVAYEGINTGEALWIPTYGDKIPVNRKQRFDELMAMLGSTSPLVSAQYVRAELAKIGYVFPDDTTMMSQILEEKQMVGAIEADAMGARLDSELGAVPPPDEPTE